MQPIRPVAVSWDERGLAPAIVQDARSGQVRMLGWMNAEALERTLETGDVWFFSRSRQTLWRKGETSGNTLSLVEARLDCDTDAILVRVDPAGPTCHTGAASCFSSSTAKEADGGPEGAAPHVVDELAATLRDRASADPLTSYTAALLARGVAAISEKIAEESTELIAALAGEPDERVASEAADVIYHLLVGLCARGIEPRAVWAELESRRGVSGHDEKSGRSG